MMEFGRKGTDVVAELVFQECSDEGELLNVGVVAMDDVGMNTGVIPVRHASLPGHVRLPPRYEHACRDVSTHMHVRRKASQHAHVIGDTLRERMEDLMQAVLWIKQELIMLRQHDILLKRQFFNIQDTIQSLQPPSLASTPVSVVHDNDGEQDGAGVPNGGRRPTFPAYENFLLKTLLVRPSSSATVLNNDVSEDDDGDASPDEFRPRTSSMKTSRDLAALARRRGSKELV